MSQNEEEVIDHGRRKFTVGLGATALAGLTASCASGAVNDGGGYRFLYVAGEQCGNFHSYDSLNKLTADLREARLRDPQLNDPRLNPRVIYARPDNGSAVPYIDPRTGEAAPGELISAPTGQDAINYLSSRGVHIFDISGVTLLAPDNTILLHKESKDPDFSEKMIEALQQHRAQQAQKGASQAL